MLAANLTDMTLEKVGLSANDMICYQHVFALC